MNVPRFQTEHSWLRPVICGKLLKFYNTGKTVDHMMGMANFKAFVKTSES